jgi:hypothetical protein
MSTFQFDYELNFTNTFDASIITNSEIPDKDDIDLQGKLQEEFDKINGILNLHPGVKVLSSFVHYNSTHYKITVSK